MNDATSVSVLDTLSIWMMVKACMTIVLGWLLAKLVQKLFVQTTQHKLTAHSRSITSRAIFYSIFILFVVMSIDQLGFKLGVLLGAAGILTVAVGFASQTSASNLISGLFLLGEKPFQIGDLIQVGTDTGEVISIDLLSVKLRTFDNLFVRIPNEALIKTTFVNLSKFPIRRIDLIIGVAYKEDIKQVSELLLAMADDELRILEEPVPTCMLSDFAASSVDLKLSVWTKSERFREVRSDLLMQIKALFDEKGIEIPFPHVSVYSGSQTTSHPISIVEPEQKT